MIGKTISLLIVSSFFIGSLDASNLTQYRQLVVEKVKIKIPKMRKCYQSQLDKQGHIKGRKVTFVLTIAKEGYLEQIHVRESFSMDVLRCVNSNLAGMQFSPPPGGKPFVLELPLNFKINYR